MAYVQDIKVSILNGAKAVAQKGFGLPLIIVEGATAKEIAPYGSSAEVASAFTGTPAGDMASAIFKQEPSPKVVYVAQWDKITVPQIKTFLTTCLEKEPGFWAIFTQEDDGALHPNHADIISWCDDNKKFYFGCCNAAATLPAAKSDRAAYLIHDNPGTTYPQCAWAGMCLPMDPGSITWKWKSPAGVASYTYTTAQLDAIRAANAQAITEYGGVTFVNEGKAIKGQYIDVIRGQDFIKARIEEGLYSLFLSNGKVAMDNTGIAQVEAVIRSVMKQAGNMGIIARATTESELTKSDDKEFMYQVTVPLREEILAADREHRILPNVKFSYYLAGAIHEANVTGTIVI